MLFLQIAMLIVCVAAINLPCDETEFCEFMEDAMGDVGCECICGCGTEKDFELSPAHPSHLIPSLITLPQEFSFVTSSATSSDCYFNAELGDSAIFFVPATN